MTTWCYFRSFVLITLLVVSYVSALASQFSHGLQQLESSANIPEKEFSALFDLYNATCGEYWHWGQRSGIRWNFTVLTNPCTDNWEGVSCTNNIIDGYEHVEMLSLNDYNLAGYLPNSMGNLTYLRNLSLSASLLTHSTIPETIGMLKALQVLYLSESNVAGTLPKSIGNLGRLQVLDVSYNALSGEFPTSVCNLAELISLHLEVNHFTGTIPECVGQLLNLQTLDCNNNRLNGTLPSSIGNLVHLQGLSVRINKFTGPIPNAFATLTQLTILVVSHNHLTGTIPAFLGLFPLLLEVDMSTNFFSGTMPAALGNLPQLKVLYLYSNNINGTIPHSFANLTSLVDFDIDNNQLTGAVPEFFGALTKLFFLSLYDNQFSSTLPKTLCDLLLLGELDFGSNYMTGPVPRCVGNMTGLGEFIGSNNLLTGAIPSGLFFLPLIGCIELSDNKLSGQLPQEQPLKETSRLFFLSVGLNHLTGPIPATIGNCRELLFMNLSRNALTGPLPDSVCHLTSLDYLYLGYNTMSGVLPDCWQHLNSSLSSLFLNDNHLTGGIPVSLGKLLALTSLNLSSNYLSGSIPSTFAELSALQVLLLQSNELSGSIAHLTNSTTQGNLTVIELSDNQLSGTLPDDLFGLPALKVIAAVSNCFSGSIPLSACASSTVVTIALDGLQSATSCQNKLFPASFNGIVSPELYSIRSPLTGGIPTCLFQMANLTTLHLSGNGLTGTLPGNLTLSESLTDLSLSHNMLRGTVPRHLLSRHWSNLDLSYNRFTDSLRIDGAAFAVEDALSLQQNRLSGVVPGALHDVETISVLETNHFACDFQHRDLPRNDPDRGKYQCGSDTWNATIYAWLAVVVVVAIAAAVVLRWRRRSWEAEIALVRQWWEAGGLMGKFAAFSSELDHYSRVCTAVTTLEKFSMKCFVYTALVLLPIYLGVSQYFGTYQHAYAWDFSAAYLSGALAFSVIFVALVLLIAFAGNTALNQNLFNKNAHRQQQTGAQKGTCLNFMSRSVWNRVIVYGSYIAVNFAIVLGVNIAYVVIALNQNGEALTLAQISLAVFKVAFNGVCSPLLIRWTSHRVLKSSEEASTADLISIQLFVTLVNNILIPCLVVAIISPDCFYNVFNAASKVTSSFDFSIKCIVFDPRDRAIVPCADQQVYAVVTSYNPPFAYSYQCSSSFITYYAPAYVIMCIIASFAIPVAQVVLQRLHSRAEKGTRWFALLDLLLPRILKPLDAASPPGGRNVFAPYFDATQHMITLLTYVGLLLTFGAVFPPLALCFALTIVSIAVFTKLKVGRLLTQVVELAAPQYLAVVNKECEGVGSPAILGRSIGMMVVFSCLFYTLFLFDTLGDAVGVSKSYWVLIAIPLLSPMMYAVFTCYLHFAKPTSGTVKLERSLETELVMVEIDSPLVKI